MFINEGWYNLEDRDNYDFASYIIIVETDENRNYNMFNDYEEANVFKNKYKNDKKYISVSKVWKINKKTHNLLWGVGRCR